MKGISQYLILMTLLVISTQAQPPERDGIDAHYEKNGSRLMDQTVRSKPKAEPTSGTLRDGRDGRQYPWVRVGKLKWMARNLDFKMGNSWCYGNDTRSCDVLGRMYDWNTARKACPKGWHLPHDAEWMYLLKFAERNPNGYPKEGEQASALPGWLSALVRVNNTLDDINSSIEEAGDNISGDRREMRDDLNVDKPEVSHILKSTRGWYANGNGTDAFGFSALPGGQRSTRGSFEDYGQFGFWWSLGSSRSESPRAWGMGYSGNKIAMTDLTREPGGLSVRCVQD